MLKIWLLVIDLVILNQFKDQSLIKLSDLTGRESKSELLNDWAFA